MNNKAKWMGEPGPGYEVGRPRLTTHDAMYQDEVRLYEQEQRQKAALARRVGQKTVTDLQRIQRKLERDTRDAEALKHAERSGNTTLVNAIRARMSARNLGVDV